MHARTHTHTHTDTHTHTHTRPPVRPHARTPAHTHTHTHTHTHAHTLSPKVLLRNSSHGFRQILWRHGHHSECISTLLLRLCMEPAHKLRCRVLCLYKVCSLCCCGPLLRNVNTRCWTTNSRWCVEKRLCRGRCALRHLLWSSSELYLDVEVTNESQHPPC